MVKQGNSFFAVNCRLNSLVSTVKRVLTKSVDNALIFCLVYFLVGSVVEVECLLNLVCVWLHVFFSQSKAIPVTRLFSK